MSRFTSLRARLVGTVFLAVIPAWILMYFLFRRTAPEQNVSWMFLGGAIAALALGAAGFSAERFVLRQVRALCHAARQLAMGDFSCRTGLSKEGGELGELARTFDQMAEELENQAKERAQGETTLVTRSLQQTVVSALGQFALLTHDFSALLNQAAILVAQTLEVEYCSLMELLPGGKHLLLRAGVGWKQGQVGSALVPVDRGTQFGFTLTAGEPVTVEQLATESRFTGCKLLFTHGVVSGVTVAIAGYGQGHAFGVLGAHTTSQRSFTEDEVHFLLSVATLLAMAEARRRAESDLENLAAFTQLNPNPVMELAADGTLTYFNAAARKLADLVEHEHPRTILPSNVPTIVRTCVQTGNSRVNLETQVEGRTLSWSFHPVSGSQVVHAYVEDITERLNLAAQLRHSQKMESIGQLAAGVAHDFNNMLTIIQGHSGMLLAKSSQRPELQDSAQAIYFAAERAANLTKQLLMFSRKNVIQRQQADLREVVSHMNKMLQRLLGETISLVFCPPPKLPLVNVDAGMVEQVIMNLAVNARDAMPKGGTLTIKTHHVELNDAYAQTHPEARPGAFVCLRVTDTGCGMDAYTQARIFEPFFTTKEVGKGTGLGLATVYGIVKQHEGWLEVESKVGAGTSFSLFFPATGQATEMQPDSAAPAPEIKGGKEKILIVEDEPVLRDMAHVILQECGYKILMAGSGREALEIWEKQKDTIDLVLTDMVMPEGISGMDLAHRLLKTKPNLRLIFASGYSMDEMDTEFVRKGHASFLQKPYTHVTLAKAVRDCLDKEQV